ncbi:Proteasome subunit beta type-6 [Conglomerata obtusa]
MHLTYLKKHTQERFDPYENNAGTSLAINHKNTIIIASDTRHSSEMGINSRNTTKIYKLQDIFLVTTGFYADGYDISIKIKHALIDYEIRNKQKMSVISAAHLLHNILYGKRFFPYYSYCLICGFHDGKAYVYSYDPVGSYASTSCRVDGSGACMVQPLLDSRLTFNNWEGEKEDVTIDDVLDIVKVAFTSVAERDVKTGDFLELFVISENEVKEFKHTLRFD